MLQNIPKEKVLDVLKQGPSIPTKIVKIVGGDTMLIGAILSTLISTGEVKYSSLKIGGSPLYFLPEHEQKLEEFTNYLSDKDQKTVSLLKEKKVLKESSQDPLIRVSLKNIKDFAKQFKLNDEIFYRYFMVSLEEAETIAKQLIEQENNLSSAIREVKESISDQMKESSVNEIIPNEKIENTNTQKKQKVTSNKSEETEIKNKKEKSNFLERVISKIHSLGLDIINKEKIKKTEYIFVLKNHDNNEYIYCVAKEKKSINEGDLSTALVFSHQKKMPCIFITTGKPTKKVISMLEKEFKEIKVEYI
ncbi:MAG: hypothetical protein QXK76_01200 [Candidatus Woesearchaeota archaeon]